MLQLKNNFWQPVNTGLPEEFSYTNVFTVNPQNTFLCGFDGKVAKFNADTLTVLFTLPPEEFVNPALNTIFMLDSANGWAAGENGTVIRINNGGYTIENLQPMYSFRDIYFDTPDHGWMIGYVTNHPETSGIIFEYSNGFWDIHSYIDGQLYDIEFSSPGIGFIAGEFNMYRFNPIDNDWQAEDIPEYHRQYHLSLLNDNYGISVSDNSNNMIFDNGIWSPGAAANVPDLINIKTLANGSAWAISQTGSNNPNDLNEGKIQLLENNVWPPYSINYLDTIKVQPLDIGLTSISGIDKKSIWFNGQYVSIPADKDWADTIPVLNSDTFCTVLKMFSSNFGLGLNGDLLEWNGQSWFNKNISPVTSPDTSITNVCMHVFDDTTGYLCRQVFSWSTGEITNEIAKYNYLDNRLTTYIVTGSYPSNAIHFSDKNHGWAAGDQGILIKFYKNDWDVSPVITTKRLTAVFTVDSSMAWAAGDDGILLKYNGEIWEQQFLPTVQNLHSIYFTDKNNGWLTGDSGLIFHYNGTEWIKDSTGTTNALYSIYMADSFCGFAGGENGIVLQFVKPAPPAPTEKKFCEFGNTYYTYHPAGDEYAYQWQIDAGEGDGFVNLDDDNIFSGVFTDSLVLTGMPSNLYGYKFRCIASKGGVDSISNAEELKFINRWTGDIDTAWENPANWSCGSVPGENTDVIITAGDIIINSEVAIRSITVLPGVNITVAENSSLAILK